MIELEETFNSNHSDAGERFEERSHRESDHDGHDSDHKSQAYGNTGRAGDCWHHDSNDIVFE